MEQYTFRGFYADWIMYDDMRDGWIYGFLGKCMDDNKYYIQSIEYGDNFGEGFLVDEKSIGQCTGRKDKNGVKIYKGDIVKVKDNYSNLIENHPMPEFIGAVDFQDCSFVIKNDYITGYRWMDYEIEIIGNIYENSELLKQEWLNQAVCKG